MLWTPRGRGAFGWTFSSTGATRLAAAWGTTITPGNNTYGAYTQILSAANVAKDVMGIEVHVNSNAVSATARDTILTIGVDPAGGTTYADVIPHLLVSSASPVMVLGGGISYFFPIFIKAGSTVAAKASVNNATVGTLSCSLRVLGAPRDRTNMRVGTKVIPYGIATATSTGTAVTPGTTAEGTATALGTIGASDRPWFWQYGVGVNNGTITAVGYSGDLLIGSAGAKATICEDRVWMGTTTEQWSDDGLSYDGSYQGAPGDILYGRLQASGTAITGLSMAAYGVV